MIQFRTLTDSDIDSIRALAAVARAEGFRFLDRLLTAIERGEVALDQPGEFFLCAVDGARIVAVGGLTPDPYSNELGVGRIRHVFVHPDFRRAGVGRALIREIERSSGNVYSIIRLRTDTSAAARFYEALGFSPVSDSSATHIRSNL